MHQIYSKVYCCYAEKLLANFQCLWSKSETMVSLWRATQTAVGVRTPIAVSDLGSSIVVLSTQIYVDTIYTLPT